MSLIWTIPRIPDVGQIPGQICLFYLPKTMKLGSRLREFNSDSGYQNLLRIHESNPSISYSPFFNIYPGDLAYFSQKGGQKGVISPTL